MTGPIRRLAAITAGLAALAGLAGCGGPADPPADAAGTTAASAAGTSAATPTELPATPARVGTPAASQVRTFAPVAVTLPSGDTVRVVSVGTQAGALQMPVSGGIAGWWNGSASIGDPFGATVIAGHVDTRDGNAPFGQLLRARVGDVVSVSGPPPRGGTAPRVTYRVIAIEQVTKDRISTASTALTQTGPARLSLITCTGVWDPVARHYESNLVVTAVRVAPRP